MMRTEIARAASGAVTTGEGTASQKFCFNPSFSGFSGHFPEYPILPAVVQVLLGQMVTEHACGQPLKLLSLSRAKFVKELHPETIIRVESTVSAKEDNVQARIQLFSDSESAASFTLLLKGGAA